MKNPQKKVKTIEAFKEIFSVWRVHRFSIGISIVFSLLALGFGLALMSLAGSKVALSALGIAMISSLMLKILGGGRLIMRYVERLYTHNVMFKAIADLRVWFFKKLAKGAAAGLGFRHSGDILSRLVTDIETLDNLYLRIFLPFLGFLLTLLVLIASISMINIPLAFILSLLFIISGFVCPLLSAWITCKRGKNLIQGIAKLRMVSLDCIAGLKEVRVFNAAHRLQSLIKKHEAILFNEYHAQAKIIACFSSISYLCGQIAVLCIFAAAMDIGFQGIHPLQIVFCLFLTLTAFEVVLSLSKAGAFAGQIVNSALRVVNVNDGYVYVEQGYDSTSPCGFDIKICNLGFRWKENTPWLYRAFNLSIKQGQRIAIVGSSGAGKSTLAALLLKIIPATEGEIWLGDKQICDLKDDLVRSKIAWLSQETHLFDDTIRENLRLGYPDASEEELWQSLKDAAVDDVVKSFPDGLDTWLGEGGIRVSGGQGRRIALARTLLSKAPILLFDEPTTGLDVDTEKDFFQTLNRIALDRTIILIMHHLTGVEKIDYVCRLFDK